MKAQRISLLVAALTLVAAPMALAGPPQGRHGQETDADTVPVFPAPGSRPRAERP
jgi:hypothetical protein